MQCRYPYTDPRRGEELGEEDEGDEEAFADDGEGEAVFDGDHAEDGGSSLGRGGFIVAGVELFQRDSVLEMEWEVGCHYSNSKSTMDLDELSLIWQSSQ